MNILLTFASGVIADESLVTNDPNSVYESDVRPLMTNRCADEVQVNIRRRGLRLALACGIQTEEMKTSFGGRLGCRSCFAKY